MKTFKNFMDEVAEPQAGDEKKFKAKHTIQKVIDKGGKSTEDDNVFNGSNVSRAGLPSEHPPGKDERVYETTAKTNEELHPNQKVLDVAPPIGKLTAADFHHLRKKNKQNKKVEEALDSEDFEGEMAKTQLRAICDKSQKIISMLEDEDQLESWLQSKISNAKMIIDSVHDYLNYKEDDMDKSEIGNEAKVPNILGGPGSLTVLGSKSVFEKKEDEEEKKYIDRGELNIVNQMRKLPVGDIHKLTFDNGKKADIHVKDVSKALSLLANTTKPSERGMIQSSLSHSPERFIETLKTGKPVIDPEKPKITLAKSVKESMNYASDNRERKPVTYRDAKGRIKIKYVKMPRREIKIEDHVQSSQGSVEQIEEKMITDHYQIIKETFLIELDQHQILAIENAIEKLNNQNQDKFFSTAAESEEGSLSMLDFALNIK